MKTTPFLFLSLISIAVISTNDSKVKAQNTTFKLKNGDYITGKVLQNESTNEIKIIIHPQLGRIELDTSLIDKSHISPWKNTVEIGYDRANTSSNGSVGYSLESKTEYKDRNKSNTAS